jgi:5-methylcytosine-specific restriction endonuclease McrA
VTNVINVTNENNVTNVNNSADGAISDWGELLDALKQKEAIASDAKLAVSLGVSRSFISTVRSGRKGLPLRLATDVLARLERPFEIEKLKSLLAPLKVQILTRKSVIARQSLILRANGCCELCGNLAPFQDQSGLPFLQVHHVIPFRDGGGTTPDNLVVLCPNCYCKVSVNPTAADISKLERVVANYKNWK